MQATLNPTRLFHVYHIHLQFDEALDVIQMDGDADFELQRLSMFFSSDGDVQTASTRAIASINFNMRDRSTGRNVFSDYADSGAIFGDGTVPFVLPTTHYFKRSGQIAFLYDAVNPGPDFDNGSLHLQLIGRKHFGYGKDAS